MRQTAGKMAERLMLDQETVDRINQYNFAGVTGRRYQVNPRHQSRANGLPSALRRGQCAAIRGHIAGMFFRTARKTMMSIVVADEI